MRNAQGPYKKYTSEGDLLPILKLHIPYHWHCKNQDHEVDEQVCHPIPAVELILIQTAPSLNRLIPEERDRFALEDCDDIVHQKIGYHDEPRKNE